MPGHTPHTPDFFFNLLILTATAEVNTAAGPVFPSCAHPTAGGGGHTAPKPGVHGHCSWRLPPPLLHITGCHTSAPKASHMASLLVFGVFFIFLSLHRCCLSGNCSVGTLCPISFLCCSYCCHSSSSCNLMNEWVF